MVWEPEKECSCQPSGGNFIQKAKQAPWEKTSAPHPTEREVAPLKVKLARNQNLELGR